MNGTVNAVHDVSDGGLLVAVAEMALAGEFGVQLSAERHGLGKAAYWFGEDQARCVVTVPQAHLANLLAVSADKGIPAFHIGDVAGHSLSIEEDGSLSLDQLNQLYEGFLPNLLA